MGQTVLSRHVLRVTGSILTGQILIKYFLLLFVYTFLRISGRLKVCQVFGRCLLRSVVGFLCLLVFAQASDITNGVLHKNIKYRRNVSQTNDTHVALPDMKLCSLFTEKLVPSTDSHYCLWLCGGLIWGLNCQGFTWIAQWWNFERVSSLHVRITCGTCKYSVLFQGIITWGRSVPEIYRTPPGTQLCGHSCWSHILAGKPRLGSFPSTFCMPALEGLVVKHTEAWTCASCHLGDGVNNLTSLVTCCHACVIAAERSVMVQFKASPWLRL